MVDDVFSDLMVSFFFTETQMGNLGRSSISVIYPDAIRCTERPLTFVLTYAGIVGNGHLCAIGYSAGNDLLVPMNCSDIGAHTREKNDSNARSAIRSL